MNSDVFWDILNNHKGKIIGIVIGLSISLLIIEFGLLKGMFIILCCSAGYYIGRLVDKKGDLREILEHILPHSYR